MSIKIFFELVEIKAKTASVLPFLIGLCYSYYHYGQIHLGYVAIYFIAMFIFNMAVDILDNYNDFKNATDVHDYKEKTNVIGRENLSLVMIRWMIISMILFSASLGIWLASQVGWPLLWMGLYCYLVGIFYSSGPRPLSSLPLGEFFSGFTMGMMISLITVYLNASDIFQWQAQELLNIAVIALPNTMWIANLMLANNICDLEEDQNNNRYTLVHYLGKPKALKLFVLLNAIALISIGASVLLGIAPTTVLLSYLIVPFIWKQTNIFLQKQEKLVTFSTAIKILAIGSTVQVLTYFIGIIFVR
ncbi:1,4-dihydroxy-2-naphthoate polyprenyltransferase [Enterococcus eurekensis]|uniref:Prenyltransferase n=1 Tax=Enterococcus eurekensis TaxID=1159753 RepID=A0ABV9M5K6_9ENTE